MISVAVISDTHLPRGSRRLPVACVRRLERADVILHCGDLVSSEFLAELRRLGPPVEGVHGNRDDHEVRQALPRELVVQIGSTAIGLVHAPGPSTGRAARLTARFPGCAAVIYGHTHVPEISRAAGVWILNPGSPTERRSAPGHTMIELVVAGQELRPTLVALAG